MQITPQRRSRKMEKLWVFFPMPRWNGSVKGKNEEKLFTIGNDKVPWTWNELRIFLQSLWILLIFYRLFRYAIIQKQVCGKFRGGKVLRGEIIFPAWCLSTSFGGFLKIFWKRNCVREYNLMTSAFRKFKNWNVCELYKGSLPNDRYILVF